MPSQTITRPALHATLVAADPTVPDAVPEGRDDHRGFTLLSRAVVWHSVLCLYIFEKTR